MSSSSSSSSSSSPEVDVVLVFSTKSLALAKKAASEEAQQAQAEYTRLKETLAKGGLLATGRSGISQGQILILVYAPWSKVEQLVRNERHSDFLLGLPTSTLPAKARDYKQHPLTAAERLRLIHEYLTATVVEGGLGVVPGANDWPRLQSVMALHDRDYNDMWIHTWTHRQIGFGVGYKELTKIKDQFGEAVALYFAFLSSYTKFLIFPSVLGALFFAKGRPYDPVYSTATVLWSIVFVEWWRIKERILSVRWGSYGSFRVEKRRPHFRGDKQTTNDDESSFPWWKRESRILASIPVILLFALVLVIILSGIFVFEAFVTQLYTGPGNKYISFSPTILFIALVPRLLALYHNSAIGMTNWENHSHQSAYDYSLTIKTFALNGLVAYSGLALSAFVYVPFHEEVMTFIYNALFAYAPDGVKGSLFEHNLYQARSKINPSRLQNQMFAFTVTNQVINFGVEVILPFVLRKADSVKSNGFNLNGKKKRVGFDDVKADAKEEREFLEGVRHQVALPDYTLFGDYAEMATQFGYIAVWSTIWPLAPLMAFLNNWFEMRGDAFKIVMHSRRPLPQRADTIGPWVQTLAFISWMSALTNSALVYLFEPDMTQTTTLMGGRQVGTTLDAEFTSPARLNATANASNTSSVAAFLSYKEVLVTALLIALSSSHGYILVRVSLRHMLTRLFWKGTKEERQAKEADREVKTMYLRSLVDGETSNKKTRGEDMAFAGDSFWARDDGLNELQGAIKED